jgi:four helix bundle protein
METENRFEKLEVWKESHKLALGVYKSTKRFPNVEKFRLADQLRRSASSVPTNIVEGNARRHKKEYLRFLYIAKGSLDETKYHLLLARDLCYLDDGEYDELVKQCNKVGRLLSGLIRYLKYKV